MFIMVKMWKYHDLFVFPVFPCLFIPSGCLHAIALRMFLDFTWLWSVLRIEFVCLLGDLC